MIHPIREAPRQEPFVLTATIAFKVAHITAVASLVLMSITGAICREAGLSTKTTVAIACEVVALGILFYAACNQPNPS